MVNFDFKLYDFKDKDKALFNLISDMFKITLDMFDWENLPSTIPERELEMLLQMRGSCIVADHKGSLYALGGNLGGDCDAYYIPRFYIVANPWLKLNKTFERDVDCVFGVNDKMWTGLVPLMERYGTLSLETDLSIYMAVILERLHSLLRCGNDSEKVSFETLINRLVKGEFASAIVSDTWLTSEGMSTLPFAGGDHANKTITELIELRQYTRASWFNDLGLQANYNMKREAINSQEGQLNEDGLLPLVESMLECRQEFADKINDMFGTSITVDLSGAWKARQTEFDASIKQMEDIINGEEDTNDSGNTAGGNTTEDREPERGGDTVDGVE